MLKTKNLIPLLFYKDVLIGLSKSPFVHGFPHLHVYVHYFLNAAHNLLMVINYHMELTIILSN